MCNLILIFWLFQYFIAKIKYFIICCIFHNIHDIFYMSVPYLTVFFSFKKMVEEICTTIIHFSFLPARKIYPCCLYKFCFICCFIVIKYPSNIALIIIVCACFTTSLKIVACSWCINIISNFTQCIRHIIRFYHLQCIFKSNIFYICTICISILMI